MSLFKIQLPRPNCLRFLAFFQENLQWRMQGVGRGGSRIPRRRGREPSRRSRQHTNFLKDCMKLIIKFGSVGGRALGSATGWGRMPSPSKFFHFHAVFGKNLHNNWFLHPSQELASIHGEF